MHIGIRKTELMSLSVETGSLQFEHFHEEPELIMVLEGELRISIEGERYILNREDCFLINSNCRHICVPEDRGCFLRLAISFSQLKKLLGYPVLEFWCNSAVDEGENYVELRKTLRELLAICIRAQDTDILDFYAKSYQCIRILAERFLIYKGSQTDEKVAEDERRYREIVNYIHENYSRHIGLEDVADTIHLTSAYLSKYIKKKFGVNFVKYLNEVRMSHAVEAILDTEESITQIAYDNGFPNMASFNKVFKENYGTTPLAYRLKIQKERQEKFKSASAEVEKRRTLMKVTQYLQEHTEDMQEKTSRQEEIVVSKTGGEIFRRSWSEVINAGSAEDLLQSTLQEHILMLKNELGFKYVRFWNIFGNGMHVAANKQGNYNFTNVYRVLDFLQMNGIKPYIELGIKPKQIFKSIANMIEIQDDTKIDSIDDLKSILKSFMSHIVRRYGAKEVNTWYFESWQDPKFPLDGEGFTYFDRFNISYEIIKTYAPMAKVGGGGVTISNPTVPEVETVITQWKKYGKMPDFFSINVFPYPYMSRKGKTIQIRENTKQSTDVDFLKNQIAVVKQCMKRLNFEPALLHVTEWNSTLSNRNYMNDSCYKAAYLVRSLTSLRGDIDVLAYYLASDMFGAYFDTGLPLNGGAGLITKDGIFKPAFYALKFLNRLDERMLCRTENCIITADDKDGYHIVCSNYKQLNYQYYLQDEEFIDAAEQEKYFEDEKEMILKIQLDDIRNGVYKIKSRKINRRYGSVLDEWRRMDLVESFDPEDVEYLKKVCIPKRVIKYENVEFDTLNIDIELEAHEIIYIHVEYRGQ